MARSKTMMTDSKIVKTKTGRVSLSFYQGDATDDELDLILSLLGAYNTCGRKFNIKDFTLLQIQFNEMIEKADGIKLIDAHGYREHGWTNNDAQAEEDYHMGGK